MENSTGQHAVSDRRVKRPVCLETTALGSAMLAGLSVGLWDSQEELTALWREEQTFTPSCTPELRERNLARWHRAVERSMGWAE